MVVPQMQTNRTTRSNRPTVRLAGVTVAHSTVTAATQAQALYTLLVNNLPVWPR